ncbi:hypothetical protein WSK_1623 [Novosphingobium sp. Rr 2-17]|uniref:hypothetical protein n=1 Tax=Novosphingobium sp. Rr 2-17 TaxID=555793 RepID=UPI0002699B98|nr:hypothetical protein [Novosphingobium sp. Rr 2-17]EIZ79734.1 hypothetical protein WSK_1623 [Novosphingobium sp. Rr 2-17]
MPTLWTREFLAHRIDRCYLIAAWTKVAEKRRFHLELARHYRAMLANLMDRTTPHLA